MSAFIYGTDEYLNLAIHKFNKLLPPLNLFTYKVVEGEVLQRTQVNVGLVQNQQTASVFNGAYSGSTYDSITQVPVTLQHLIKPFAWPQTLSDINPLAELTNISDTNMHALANSIFSASVAPLVSGSVSASIFTSANGFSTAISGSSNTNFTYGNVQTVANYLASQSADLSQCALLAPAAYYVNAIPVANAIGVGAIGTAAQGGPGTLAGWFGMKYAPFTAQFDYNNVVKGAGIAQGAVAVAVGIPAVSDTVKNWLVRYELLEIPNFGAKIAYREWVDPNSHAPFGCFEVMVGAAAGNTDAATLIY